MWAVWLGVVVVSVRGVVRREQQQQRDKERDSEMMD
jgi:hypothetical protein